jgi:hypothetical protein
VSEPIRCPVCRADNPEGPSCRRCRADLTLLFRLEGQRERALGQARRYALAGEGAETLREARRAHALRAGEDSRRLLALGHLLSRDFAEAWRRYLDLAPKGRNITARGNAPGKEAVNSSSPEGAQ